MPKVSFRHTGGIGYPGRFAGMTVLLVRTLLWDRAAAYFSSHTAVKRLERQDSGRAEAIQLIQVG